QLSEPSCDQIEQSWQLQLANEGVADLVERFELARPAGCGFVKASIFDGYSDLCGKKSDELLVLFCEVFAPFLLGQVQVSVRNAPQHDRYPEEAAHLRVIPRKADRARMLGEVVKAQRPGVLDQHSEYAAPPWKLTDRAVHLGIDAVRHESLEL